MSDPQTSLGVDSRESTNRQDRILRSVLAVVGAGTAGISVWMLIGPESWYRRLPAAVPDFGPFNVHFVRDLGCALAVVGAALLWASFEPAVRRPLTLMATAFFVLHALVHVYETLRGHVHAGHWAIDSPLTYLPVLLLLPCLVRLYRKG